MQILIGADPEVFMTNPNTGKFISAHGMIKGTKEKPFKVPRGAVQVDGNALEFNIDPARTKQEFVGNIKEVYNTLKGMVPGYNLAITPTAVFDKDYFDKLPKEAKELGCDPDFNAWTRSVNPRPTVTEPFRTAGGHVHIGWRGDGASLPLIDPHDPEHFDDCCEIIKQMDYYLGVWSLLWDKDSERRSLYGKAGCFRPKPYGVEYRSLSNAWLKHDELIEWIYDAAQAGMKAAQEGKFVVKKQGNKAQEIIDSGNYNWGHNYYITAPGLPSLPKVPEIRWGE